MANATIQSVPGTQVGNFSLEVSLAMAVSDLEKANFVLRALTENGITGVDFSVSGVQPGISFMLMFTIPANVEGSFEISMTGMVTPQGRTPEAVMANTVVIYYDTTANVTATFGTVEYRDNGVIAVPVIFVEKVVVPSKTVFRIRSVNDSDLSGIEYTILGKNTAFELVFTVPPDRKGRFEVSGVGDVLKTSSGIFDNVVVTPLTVDYDTSVPRIVDFDVPASYDLGSPVDIFVAYNVIVTGWNANNTITEEGGIFELEGAHLGTPSAYKWIGSSPPNFESLSGSMPNLRNDNGQYDIDANTAALLNLGWQGLATPPAGSPTPGMNGYDNSDPPIWHGESGQYFLIRFSNPQEVGIFNLRERAGVVRGPVS